LDPVGLRLINVFAQRQRQSELGGPAMSYKSILTHVPIGHDHSNVFAVSGQLAEMFDAQIIGISGAQLTRPYSEVPVADIMQREREAAENALKQVEL
jgi:hypothetical protein